MNAAPAFPVYRKYANEKSYFKITSETRFEEWKRTGKLIEHFVFEAKIFPDRQLILDMIEMRDNHWLPAEAHEIDALIA